MSRIAIQRAPRIGISARPFALDRRRQSQGLVLFVALVLLLVLTITGISAVQSTSLEETMARNANDSVIAFQAAESALRDAEGVVAALTDVTTFDDVGTNGRWIVAPVGDPQRWEDPDAWDGVGPGSVTGTAVAISAEAPRFMIEHVATVLREENAYQIEDPYGGGAEDRIEVFRVTARGVGGTANARVMLQSTFGRILE